VEFRGNRINAIAVGPNGDGWVVGSLTGEGGSMGALTRLQGGKGRAVPFPQLGGPGIADQSSPLPEVYISGLAVPAPDDVWAVGGDNPVPLIAHWDGRSWSSASIEAPDQTPPLGSLTGVATLPPADVLAVGYIGYSGYEGTSLAMRQDCR
jgi:hypothetical protein